MKMFSVIIPTGREEKALSFVLESLLRQAPVPLEVIVVDDRPTPSAFAICKRFFEPLKLEYIRFQRDRSDGSFRLSEARNLGVKNSIGSHLIFLDGDCVPDFDWLERYAQAVTISEKIMVTGFRRMLTEEQVSTVSSLDYRKFKELAYEDNLREEYRRNPAFPCPWHFWTHNAACDAKTFCEVGGFDESFITYGQEDVDLGMRLRRAGCKHIALKEGGWVTHFGHPKLYNEYTDLHKTRSMMDSAPLVRNGGPLVRSRLNGR